jgi:toxin ParE1/3/4
MPTIVKSPRAREDLIEIWEFIAADDEHSADEFVAIIDEKFRVLAERPSIGRLRNELVEGLRIFPIGRYVIFYLAIPDGIEIVRVLHGARDVDSILGPKE